MYTIESFNLIILIVLLLLFFFLYRGLSGSNVVRQFKSNARMIRAGGRARRVF